MIVFTNRPNAEDRSGVNTGSGERSRRRVEKLRAAGAVVVELHEVEPASVIADLGSRGYESVLVEGGGEVHDAFRASACFDRVAVCQAPLLIGGRNARPAVGGEGAERLVDALQLEDLETQSCDRDLLVEGMVAGRLDQLLNRLPSLSTGHPQA